MAATIEDIFGFGSYISSGRDQFVIPVSALQSSGLLDLATDSPLPILAAIAKKANDFLKPNTDESINASSENSTFSPSTRNGVDKTQFSITLNFFAPYTAPDLDPDLFL